MPLFPIRTSEPNLQVLIRIAAVLDTTPNQLLGVEPPATFKKGDEAARLRGRISATCGMGEAASVPLAPMSGEPVQEPGGLRRRGAFCCLKGNNLLLPLRPDVNQSHATVHCQLRITMVADSQRSVAGLRATGRDFMSTRKLPDDVKKIEYLTGVLSAAAETGQATDYGYNKNHLPETTGKSRKMSSSFEITIGQKQPK